MTDPPVWEITMREPDFETCPFCKGKVELVKTEEYIQTYGCVDCEYQATHEAATSTWSRSFMRISRKPKEEE